MRKSFHGMHLILKGCTFPHIMGTGVMQYLDHRFNWFQEYSAHGLQRKSCCEGSEKQAFLMFHLVSLFV